MSIKKTLLLASMALAAIAFMAPAAAQATVKLTDPNNQALGQGALVTATSTNLKTTTEAGILECAKVTLHLEVKSNSQNHILLEELGSATTEGCGLNVGVATLPTTITGGTIGVGEDLKLTINTWGRGSTTATFVSHTYENAGHTVQLATCHFTGLVSFAATHETDILHAGPSQLTKTTGEESCPAATGSIAGTFTIETSNGAEVKIDFNTGATP